MGNILLIRENCHTQVCSDVAGLLSWTCAMSFFYGINKEVLPLKANLAISEVKLQAATNELNDAQATLDQKQAELDEVQAMYDGAMKEKQVGYQRVLYEDVMI